MCIITLWSINRSSCPEPLPICLLNHILSVFLLFLLFLSLQVTVVLQECAMKMKGLMPAELRQELEDTISSLKSQVGTSPAWGTIHRTHTAYS